LATKVSQAVGTNGRLPKGWQLLHFEEFAESVTERVDPAKAKADVYIGLEHLDSESLTIRRCGEPSDVIGQKLRFQTGDIIFGKRRAYQRKLGVAHCNGICSAHALVVRANPDVIDPLFLPFFMQTDLFMDRAVAISVGSLSPTINWRTLRKQQFAIPPKEEQRQIANILGLADETLERHREVDHALRALQRTTINEFVRTAAPKESRCTLDDVANITDCKHRTPTLVERGFPMVAPGNIAWGPLKLSSCKQISHEEGASLMDHVSVQPWDLVFSRNQTFGVASYVTKGQEFAIGQDTILIQTGKLDTRVIYLLLQSSFVQNQIDRLAMGSTFKRINLGDIRRLRVPMVNASLAGKAEKLIHSFEESALRSEEKANVLLCLKRDLRRQLLQRESDHV
jgi:type I restriction enzyme S subunit